MKHPDKQGWTALAAIVLFYLVIESLGVTCPIRFMTGVSCAGCGMSRAWLALLRGNLAEAARFHPLFWLPVPAAAPGGLRRIPAASAAQTPAGSPGDSPAVRIPEVPAAAITAALAAETRKLSSPSSQRSAARFTASGP